MSARPTVDIGTNQTASSSVHNDAGRASVQVEMAIHVHGRRIWTRRTRNPKIVRALSMREARRVLRAPMDRRLRLQRAVTRRCRVQLAKRDIDGANQRQRRVRRAAL